MVSTHFIQPSLYTLSGGNLQITYALTGPNGQPQFTYQDPNQGLTFTGNQIQVVDTELGKVVSVRIRMTVDTGSTTFSVLLPRVNLIPDTFAAVHTEGITTLHRFSIFQALDRGQQDFYTVTPLQGFAY